MANIVFIKLPNASLYKNKNLTLLEPLGLEYLISAVRKYHDVDLVDLDICSPNSLLDIIRIRQPDFIGTTVSTPMVLEAKQVIEGVKRIKSDIKVIIGGGHPSALPEEALDYTGADIAVVGEGEIVLNDILEGRNTNRIVQGIQCDVDLLDFPARDLTARNKYEVSYSFDSKGLQRCASMITSRGCPFPCNYCASKTIHGAKVRFRDIDSIIMEISELINSYGIQAILFLDDCFTLREDRVIELCDKILERELKFNWWLDTRVDCMSERMLVKMKEAGCGFIVYGVESGSQKVLDRIGKKIKLEDVRKTFKLTHEVGIATKANFMLGHLEETEEDVIQTISLARELKATRYGFYLTLPLPGSPLYDIAVKKGLITKSFDHFKWYDIPVSEISKIEPNRILELQKKAYEECKFKS